MSQKQGNNMLLCENRNKKLGFFFFFYKKGFEHENLYYKPQAESSMFKDSSHIHQLQTSSLITNLGLLGSKLVDQKFIPTCNIGFKNGLKCSLGLGRCASHSSFKVRDMGSPLRCFDSDKSLVLLGSTSMDCHGWFWQHLHRSVGHTIWISWAALLWINWATPPPFQVFLSRSLCSVKILIE